MKMMNDKKIYILRPSFFVLRPSFYFFRLSSIVYRLSSPLLNCASLVPRPSSIVALFLIIFSSSVYALSEPYRESFDSMQDGVTINAADSWTVSSGSPDNALILSGDTASGSGKSLKLTGALIPVDAARTADYSSLSPTWVEYVVKASMSSDEREIPSTGIAAVTFSPTGNIMISDGTEWVNSGKTFTADTWYRIILKLDFSTRRYDVYIENASLPKSPFVPNKENLNFIDPTINSLNQLGFAGAYNARNQADSLVDEVVAHSVDKLQFINSPHTLVKGYASGVIIVQLQNSNSEPQTAWKDVNLELRSSTATAEFSLDKENWAPISTVVIPEGSQQVSFYFMDFEEGRPTITANEFPDRGWTDATQEEKVVQEGDYFSITTTTPQVAGLPFEVQITAMDGRGSADASYAGSVKIFAQYISPLTGNKIITPDVAGDFVLGVKTVNLTYPDAGKIKIAVQDAADSQKIGYSGDVSFAPHFFEVDAGSAQVVGKSFSMGVKALNSDGQITPNYQGPARIEVVPSVPGGSLNPSQLAQGAFQNGAATLNTSYNRWGTFQFKAIDEQDGEKTGISGSVKFIPKSIAIDVKKPSATRSFFYVAENMEITVSVLGDDGLPIENFQGTLSLTPKPALDIPLQYIFSAQDKGQKKFVVPAGKEGKYTLSAQDVENNLNQESDSFEVKDAVIQVSSTSAPVGSTVVEIQLLDSAGQRLRDENEMTITILFQEENENGSVFFSELGKPILFKKGLAKIVIGNSEAETVTVSAKSAYGLKTSSGKVLFGRAGPSGVGTLMLREKKD